MTTEFDMLQAFVNFTIIEFKCELGRPLQSAESVAGKPSFLTPFLQPQIFYCHCKEKVELLPVLQSPYFYCFAGIALTKTRLFLFNQRLFETLFRLVAQGESATLTR